MGKKLDLTNKRFGRLVAKTDVGKNKSGAYIWECKCECGNIVNIASADLVRGHSTSCGCVRIDSCLELSKKGLNINHSAKTHGMSQTRIYRIWKDMLRRTNNPDRQNYSYYGGRGIGVCEEWKNSFELFYDWSVANGYSDSLEIDRKDNDKNYCPENCRWVEKTVNANNRSTSRNITYKGATKTVAEWSRIVGIPYTKLIYRLNAGWELDRVFAQ